VTPLGGASPRGGISTGRRGGASGRPSASTPAVLASIAATGLDWVRGALVGTQPSVSAGGGFAPRLVAYERMFEDLSEHQLKQLTKVWEATHKAMHWRENTLNEMGRALAAGCTPEHLAAVTGFNVEVVKRLLHRPRQEFNGRHPTDRHAPGQDQFYR
jgi:hypothetical protein